MKRGFEKSAPDEVVFRVAQLFIAERQKMDREAEKIDRKLTEAVAKKTVSEFPAFPKTGKFTREMVYPLAAEAVSRGFLTLCPPLDKQLKARFDDRYPHLRDRVHVVDTLGSPDGKKVSAAAASIALTVVQKMQESKSDNPSIIGLGLGPGRATRDFCKEFGNLVSQIKDPITFNLHAISAGCPAKKPENAPISFFNLFPDHMINERIALFAETLVPTKEFENIKKRAGVKEAFEEMPNIDLVVTSMGDMNDKHDILRIFLENSDIDVSELINRGWIGNVQYRPYGVTGPVIEGAEDLRAVTLFELSQLADLSHRDDKHVILIGRQCGLCGRTRAEALRPLIEEDSKLRVFSTLIIDSPTCKDLLNPPAT